MEISFSRNLESGLPEKELVIKLQELVDGLVWHEWAIGRYLLEFDERALYYNSGCSSTTQFCQVKLKFSPRKAGELLRVAKDLVKLPALEQAFQHKQIPWTAVREVSRVAIQETEIKWLVWCKDRTVTQIERAVSATNPGDLPPEDGPLRLKLHPKLIFQMAPEIQALWEQCVERMGGAREENMNPNQVFEELLKQYLSRPLNSDEMDKRRVYQGIIHHCSSCRESYMDTDSGPLKLSPEVADNVMDQADIMDITPLEEKERVLEEAAGGPVPKEERDLPNTPELSRQVRARDGYRCAVPGCNRKGYLQAHHIVWRVNGGRTVLKNEISLCPACHQLVHSGKLVITWTRSDGLTFHRPGTFEASHSPAGESEGPRHWHA